jgi:hypothetical protein
MNFKKTSPVSAVTEIAVRFFFVLVLVPGLLSSEAWAQSGKKKAEKEKSKAAAESPGRLSYSGKPDEPGYLWPEWFLNPPPVPHGVGVAPFWKSDSARSYFEARQLAIQDLNASDRLVVTVETALSKQFPYMMAQEFAIDERFSFENTVGIDSVVIDNRVYYLVAATNVPVNHKARIAIPERPEWVTDTMTPSSTEEIYSSGGRYKIFVYTKQNSWIKTKQDALAQLAQFVSLSVKTNQKTYEQSISQTIYIKSRILIQDVMVKERWSDGTNYYMLLHVLKHNVKSLD